MDERKEGFTRGFLWFNIVFLYAFSAISYYRMQVLESRVQEKSAPAAETQVVSEVPASTATAENDRRE